MGWKPIDFQGIVTLDKSLIDQLNVYLKEKESRLGNGIVNAVHAFPGGEVLPSLPYQAGVYLKLSDAVEAFRNKIRQVTRYPQQITAGDDWLVATRQINNALWDYAETLQGFVIELFQRLNQVGFEQWHSDLSDVTTAIKEILLHRMEDLIWAISRLEPLLLEYRFACEAKTGKSVFWSKFLHSWHSLLDSSLSTSLKRNKKLLKREYRLFIDRYQAYSKMNEKIVVSLQKFPRYHILSTLDEQLQDNFKKLYHLIKLWERNSKTKVMPQRETVRAIRNVLSPERAFTLFSDYYHALRASLFERSRIIKRAPSEIFANASSKSLILEVIAGCRAELHTLGATFGSYREFLLRTDPDPYVRARWGFTESIVAPEPKETRELLSLGYEVELLDGLFERLESSLDEGPQPLEELKIAQNSRNIQTTLHEMSQPLSSRHTMRGHAENLVSQIQEMNELGSFSMDVVDLVGDFFSKAMRADWQYHVMHELPLFHQLYGIHMGIVGPSRDRDHERRLAHFRSLIQQVEKWVKERDTQRHTHEIELDINDMKQTLQDFYARVQRILKEDSLSTDDKRKATQEISEHLLEYRYLFGGFFCNLPQHESEGKLIRNQFLFVDQYFESIETTLHKIAAKR